MGKQCSNGVLEYVLIVNTTGMRVFSLYIDRHLGEKFSLTLHEYDEDGIFFMTELACWDS